ncbi:hypothetical protein WDU94_014318 [Cyamophila willieti]
MGCGLKCVDDTLKRLFFKLGVQIARTPGYFIIVPILLTIICVTGFQQIFFEMDPEYLFSPQHGSGKTERAIVESFFKMNYTARFNPTRITRPGRFGRIIAIPKHGDTMLTKEIWKELRLIDEIVHNTSIVYGEDNTVYRYEDICAKWVDSCFPNDILNLDYVMDEVETKALNLTFPIMFNPVTWDAHAFPVYFGATEISDEGTIIRVPALQMVYFVTADTKAQDARGSKWEEAFLDAIGNAEESGTFKYISTARFASRTLDIELEKNTRSVVPYFTTTFVIMATFSVLTLLMTDWVRSKPYLGLMGNVSTAMAIVAAFGAAVYLRIPFIGINFVSPLLMCSVGIDDTFVMLAAWRRTPITMSVPERMGHMMAEAAVSITITSLTDIVSFSIGTANPFPSIQIFCMYSGLAVCFIFAWHCTFFAACVALGGYAEEKNLHAFTCRKVKPLSMSGKKSWLYRMFCSGGINPKDPDNPEDNPDNAIMVWFRDTLAWYINQWWVKVLVILIFISYLGGALYGTTQLQEGLQRTKLSKKDSYSIEFYDREDVYFREFPYRIQVIVTGELPYWDVDVQNQMENLTKSFEASPFISAPLYTESWLRSFVSYVRRNQDFLNVTIDTREGFLKTLNDLWLFKPNPFSLDIKFNDDGTKIIASRFMIQAVNITDGNMEKEMVKELRRIAHESSLNVSVFHPYFVFFDQFELVRPTTFQSMLGGSVTMMFISFIFIPNILCSMWVAFSIVSIGTGVLGYMAMWSVNLDSISMINLIMCTGFSVDFTAHICYAYMSSDSNDPKERVREALYALGLPIFQGAMSTILGVSALILADSYIFLVFFKMTFMVILFGALHGMFLLPVLLSIFGPGSCTRRKKSISDIEKTFPHPYCIPHPSLHPMTHMNGKSHFGGVPLHGMVQASPRIVMSTYDGDTRGKFIVDSPENDQGLGTSEDSSESSSSRSQKQRQKMMEDDERQRRKYVEGWRKSSVPNVGEFAQPNRTSFHNAGYLSDDEVRPYRGGGGKPSQYQNNQHRPRQHYSRKDHRY